MVVIEGDGGPIVLVQHTNLSNWGEKQYNIACKEEFVVVKIDNYDCAIFDDSSYPTYCFRNLNDLMVIQNYCFDGTIESEFKLENHKYDYKSVRKLRIKDNLIRVMIGADQPLSPFYKYIEFQSNPGEYTVEFSSNSEFAAVVVKYFFE